MDDHEAIFEQIWVSAAIYLAFYGPQTVDLAFDLTAGPRFDDHCTESESEPLLHADPQIFAMRGG
jgi:hypothetical protein